jgi:hypothetical protein
MIHLSSYDREVVIRSGLDRGFVYIPLLLVAGVSTAGRGHLERVEAFDTSRWRPLGNKPALVS